MHATGLCRLRQPNRTTEEPIEATNDILLPETINAVRYVEIRRHCRLPAIASAVQSDGFRVPSFRNSIASLHCRAPLGCLLVPSLPAHMAHVTCGRDRFKIDLHCMCSVSRPLVHVSSPPSQSAGLLFGHHFRQ